MSQIVKYYYFKIAKLSFVMDKLIKINEYSKTPKYKQIVDSIISGIEMGKIGLQDRLPSVNRVLIDFDISRDTIVKAYDYLKGIGIVESMPGKGYFVISNEVRQKCKVCLLFNKLSTHKKIIYDTLAQTLGDQASIDFFIYNNDFRLFKNYVTSCMEENFTHFVIIPHFLEGGEDAYQIINKIPKHKLILLDKNIEGITGDYGIVYQDFATDIYNALYEALPLLKKYKCLKIIFPDYSYHPKEILKGFKNFCQEYAFEYSIVSNIENGAINIGDAFINLMEDDLVTLIKRIKQKHYKVGEEIGIISYNETPLKEILLNGITVVSTDFENLGRKAGEMILEHRKERIRNPFYLVVRNSL